MPKPPPFLRYPKDPTQPLKYYYVWLELPPHAGERRRIPVRSKNPTELMVKLEQKKQDLRQRGDLYTNDMTVQAWFTYWYNEDVKKNNRPRGADAYRNIVFNHVIPTIGSIRLEKLTVNHIRQVEQRMLDNGLSSTHALLAHRTMSRALEIALREGRVGRNVAKLMDAPRKAHVPQLAFEVDEAIKVLDHVSRDRIMGARWATALLTGARRGEVIGLERDRIGNDIDLSWQLQRIIWAHGCGDPVGKWPNGRDKYPCGNRIAHSCPDRKLELPADYEYRHIKGGLYWTRPKSSSGWRILPSFEPLRSILERHIESRPENEWGLVFTREDNRPIDPDQDTARWKTVLHATGIQKDVVLHGLRHTAADLLYEAGVPEDLIPLILGHSERSMSRSYQTKSLAQRARVQAALEQMSALLTPKAIEQ